MSPRTLQHYPEVMTASQVAAWLNVSRGTVYRWIRSGNLDGYYSRAVGRGSVFLFSRSKLEAFR